MANRALTLVGMPPGRAQRRPSLVMTDLLLLAGLLCAVAWITDPLGWHLEKVLFTKHLPLFVTLAGALLTLTGAMLFPRPGVAAGKAGVFALAFPLVLLGLWIVGGSLYARFSLREDNTFLISGIYLLTGMLCGKALSCMPAPIEFVTRFMKFSALCAVFMVVRMAVEFRESMVAYHELEFFVIPLAVYFMLRHERPTPFDLWAVAFFLVSGIIFRKNTGFIVAGLVATYLWFVVWRQRFKVDRAFRHTFVFLALAVVVLLAGVGAYLLLARGEYLPSGNPQYRLVTYELAWNKFVTSPVIGRGFTEAATEKFTGFDTGVANNVLPTHSDLLDIAAQGGAVGLLLLTWGYLRVYRRLRVTLLADRRDRERWALAHTLWCMSVTAIPVYIFNPIMLQPAKALVLWSLLGMLVGLSLAADPEPDERSTG